MAIYRASGAPRLVAMIQNLWATYPFGTLTTPAEARVHVIQRHRVYLDVLRLRDPAKMAAATEDHIRDARQMRESGAKSAKQLKGA